MNSDRIEADGKNCFLHQNNRNQYHTWEEAQGTNGSISLYFLQHRIITPNNPTEHQDPNTHKIPTLHETARKVARLEKQKLDEKQYIACEMIAFTFLLGLVQDGNDPNKTLIHAWDKPWEVLPLSK